MFFNYLFFIDILQLVVTFLGLIYITILANYYCLQDDKSALNRYKSFVPKDELKQLTCPGGTVKEINDVKVLFGSASRPTSSIKSWHNFCGCLCEEKYYYISLISQFTMHREENKYGLDNHWLSINFASHQIFSSIFLEWQSVPGW